MCHPTFEPQAVLGYAGRLLHFLDTHCTADRSTYWLRRDPHSDVLQLFDVSPMLDQATAVRSRPRIRFGMYIRSCSINAGDITLFYRVHKPV
eukprot:7144501-Pyramimonas_sp.AAC.1